jgi:hypothetical protein
MMSEEIVIASSSLSRQPLPIGTQPMLSLHQHVENESGFRSWGGKGKGKAQIPLREHIEVSSGVVGTGEGGAEEEDDVTDVEAEEDC